MTSSTRIGSAGELEELRQKVCAGRDPRRRCVSVCTGTGCLASGATLVADAFRAELDSQGLAGSVECRGTGCHGFCEKGPIVVIDPGETCNVLVTPADVPQIVEETVKAD